MPWPEAALGRILPMPQPVVIHCPVHWWKLGQLRLTHGNVNWSGWNAGLHLVLWLQGSNPCGGAAESCERHCCQDGQASSLNTFFCHSLISLVLRSLPFYSLRGVSMHFPILNLSTLPFIPCFIHN